MDAKTLQLIEAYGNKCYGKGYADGSRSLRGAELNDPEQALQALIAHLTERQRWKPIEDNHPKVWHEEGVRFEINDEILIERDGKVAKYRVVDLPEREENAEI